VIGPLPRSGPWPWLLPLLGAVLVALLDVVAEPGTWSVPVTGLLDEPAHLVTAWLALCALAPRSPPSWLWGTALVASVAIDIDHVPLYLTGGRFAVDGGRPPTHCLLLVVLLVAIGLVGPRARWALGAATGVLLHFIRDVATGPGVPLFWPLSDVAVQAPYRAYLAAVVVLALVAAFRSRPRCGAALDRRG
jgi:inner membrane protein